MTTTVPAATTHVIRPRRVRFDWEDTPLHWIPGDPQTTHTINVLHLLLPAGERWFGQVYRQAVEDIEDDELRKQVLGFIGQEAVHSRAHQAVLDHLADQGLDASPYTDRVDGLFATLLSDEPFGRPLPRRLGRLWLRRRLDLIAAIEHFTAVLGNWVLHSEPLDDAGADATMLDLLRWHGAEEVEHRAVAFDLSESFGAGRIRRFLAMIPAACALTVLWILGTRFLMKADPTLSGRDAKPTWRGFFRAARRGTVPTLRSIAEAVPRYLAAGYHPVIEGDTEEALAYLASSPAARAASRMASTGPDAPSSAS